MKKSKSVLLILIICFSFLFICAGIFLLYAFVFPYKLARDMYDLGFNTYSIKLYDRAYNNDKSNVDALYMALNISIKLDKSEDIEKYFEEFCANPNYYTYVESIDETNYVKKTSTLIKSSLLSEDNYLKNRYIASLISQGKINDAVSYSSNSLAINPTVENIGNYYYANFMNDAISSEDLEFFVEDNIVENLKIYFFTLHADFKDTFKLDKFAERVCAGNRIVTIGYNLMYLDARLDAEILTDVETQEIKSLILSTESAINTLLME